MALHGVDNTKASPEQKVDINSMLQDGTSDIELSDTDLEDEDKLQEEELKLMKKHEKLMQQWAKIKEEKQFGNDCQDFEVMLKDILKHSRKEVHSSYRTLQMACDYAMFWYQSHLATCEKLKEMCHEFMNILMNVNMHEKNDKGEYIDPLYATAQKWIMQKNYFHHVTISEVKWDFRKRFGSVTWPQPFFKAPWLNGDRIGWWKCQWDNCAMYTRVADRTDSCNHCLKPNWWKRGYAENTLEKWCLRG